MKNPFSGMALLIILGVLVITGLSATFTVSQTQQAIVLRFGEPVPGRGLVTEPGLHFKAPFVETVVYFDKRMLFVDSPREEVIAADNNRIEVDAFLRYRITDPLRFFQTVRTEENAANQLASVLNSSLRQVLGEATMIQIVRENRIGMMSRIAQQVNAEGARLGVNVIDVRIKRADLPRQISERVFARMQTERQQEAAEFRAQGHQRAQEIQSRADRDVTVLKAEAERKAQELRGQGDAERNRIFAASFTKDPEFFAFRRSMEAYETGLIGEDTRMIISPTSEFFRFFGNPSGLPANGARQPPATLPPEASAQPGAAPAAAAVVTPAAPAPAAAPAAIAPPAAAEAPPAAATVPN